MLQAVALAISHSHRLAAPAADGILGILGILG